MGICVPDSCSEQEVMIGLNEIAHTNSPYPDREYLPLIFACEAKSDVLEYDWQDTLFL